MIAHITPDSLHIESAIKNIGIDQKGTHRYFVLSTTPHLSHVKAHAEVVIIHPDYCHTDEFIQELASYEAIAIHFLDLRKAMIINRLPKNTFIIWVMWGDDYYKAFPQLFAKTILPLTFVFCLLQLKLSYFQLYAVHFFPFLL